MLYSCYNCYNCYNLLIRLSLVLFVTKIVDIVPENIVHFCYH